MARAPEQAGWRVQGKEDPERRYLLLLCLPKLRLLDQPTRRPFDLGNGPAKRSGLTDQGAIK
jgi:hypothetical protein